MCLGSMRVRCEIAPGKEKYRPVPPPGEDGTCVKVLSIAAPGVHLVSACSEPMATSIYSPPPRQFQLTLYVAPKFQWLGIHPRSSQHPTYVRTKAREKRCQRIFVFDYQCIFFFFNFFLFPLISCSHTVHHIST